MEKKQVKEKPKTISRGLRKETLRRFDDAKLQGVAGGAGLWRPGFADDTTPIYDDTAG